MDNKISEVIDELRQGKYKKEDLEYIVNNLKKVEQSEEELLFILGDTLVSIGEYHFALNIFKHLYNRNTHDDELIAYIVDIYITNGQIDEALLILNESKETPTVLMLKAEVFQQMHLNDVALKNLMKARNLTDDLIIDFAIAELYYYDGNFIEASYYYKNVLEEVDKVNNVNINLRLAEIYTNLLETETALSYFNEVAESEYSNDDYYLKGLLHFQQEQLLDAEKSLDFVIKNEPYYINAYILLMKIKEKEHEYTNARDLLLDYTVIDDINPLIYYHLGRLELKLGHVEEAKSHFAKATELDEDYDDALVMLFESILQSDNTEEIDEYTKHLNIKDLSPEAIHLLGTIEAYNENDAQALKYYEEADQYLNDNTEFLSDYFYYLTEIRHDKRKNVLKRLIQLEPNNTEWQLELEHLRGEDLDF